MKQKDETGAWKLDGPPKYLVSESSATCGFHSQSGNHICQSLEKDHSDLVKFSGPDDGEYKHVLHILKKIVFVGGYFGPLLRWISFSLPNRVIWMSLFGYPVGRALVWFFCLLCVLLAYYVY